MSFTKERTTTNLSSSSHSQQTQPNLATPSKHLHSWQHSSQTNIPTANDGLWARSKPVAGAYRASNETTMSAGRQTQNVQQATRLPQRQRNSKAIVAKVLNPGEPKNRSSCSVAPRVPNREVFRSAATTTGLTATPPTRSSVSALAKHAKPFTSNHSRSQSVGEVERKSLDIGRATTAGPMRNATSASAATRAKIPVMNSGQNTTQGVNSARSVTRAINVDANNQRSQLLMERSRSVSPERMLTRVLEPIESMTFKPKPKSVEAPLWTRVRSKSSSLQDLPAIDMRIAEENRTKKFANITAAAAASSGGGGSGDHLICQSLPSYNPQSYQALRQPEPEPEYYDHEIEVRDYRQADDEDDNFMVNYNTNIPVIANPSSSRHITTPMVTISSSDDKFPTTSAVVGELSELRSQSAARRKLFHSTEAALQHFNQNHSQKVALANARSAEHRTLHSSQLNPGHEYSPNLIITGHNMAEPKQYLLLDSQPPMASEELGVMATVVEEDEEEAAEEEEMYTSYDQQEYQSMPTNMNYAQQAPPRSMSSALYYSEAGHAPLVVVSSVGHHHHQQQQQQHHHHHRHSMSMEHGQGAPTVAMSEYPELNSSVPITQEQYNYIRQKEEEDWKRVEAEFQMKQQQFLLRKMQLERHNFQRSQLPPPAPPPPTPVKYFNGQQQQQQQQLVRHQYNQLSYKQQQYQQQLLEQQQQYEDQLYQQQLYKLKQFEHEQSLLQQQQALALRPPQRPATMGQRQSMQLHHHHQPEPQFIPLSQIGNNDQHQGAVRPMWTNKPPSRFALSQLASKKQMLAGTEDYGYEREIEAASRPGQRLNKRPVLPPQAKRLQPPLILINGMPPEEYEFDDERRPDTSHEEVFIGHEEVAPGDGRAEVQPKMATTNDVNGDGRNHIDNHQPAPPPEAVAENQEESVVQAEICRFHRTLKECQMCLTPIPEEAEIEEELANKKVSMVVKEEEEVVANASDDESDCSNASDEISVECGQPANAKSKQTKKLVSTSKDSVVDAEGNEVNNTNSGSAKSNQAPDGDEDSGHGSTTGPSPQPRTNSSNSLLSEVSTSPSPPATSPSNSPTLLVGVKKQPQPQQPQKQQPHSVQFATITNISKEDEEDEESSSFKTNLELDATPPTTSASKLERYFTMDLLNSDVDDKNKKPAATVVEMSNDEVTKMKVAFEDKKPAEEIQQEETKATTEVEMKTSNDEEDDKVAAQPSACLAIQSYSSSNMLLVALRQAHIDDAHIIFSANYPRVARFISSLAAQMGREHEQELIQLFQFTIQMFEQREGSSSTAEPVQPNYLMRLWIQTVKDLLKSRNLNINKNLLRHCIEQFFKLVQSREPNPLALENTTPKVVIDYPRERPPTPPKDYDDDTEEDEAAQHPQRVTITLRPDQVVIEDQKRQLGQRMSQEFHSPEPFYRTVVQVNDQAKGGKSTKANKKNRHQADEDKIVELVDKPKKRLAPQPPQPKAKEEPAYNPYEGTSKQYQELAHNFYETTAKQYQGPAYNVFEDTSKQYQGPGDNVYEGANKQNTFTSKLNSLMFWKTNKSKKESATNYDKRVQSYEMEELESKNKTGGSKLGHTILEMFRPKVKGNLSSKSFNNNNIKNHMKMSAAMQSVDWMGNSFRQLPTPGKTFPVENVNKAEDGGDAKANPVPDKLNLAMSNPNLVDNEMNITSNARKMYRRVSTASRQVSDETKQLFDDFPRNKGETYYDCQQYKSLDGKHFKSLRPVAMPRACLARQSKASRSSVDQAKPQPNQQDGSSNLSTWKSSDHISQNKGGALQSKTSRSSEALIDGDGGGGGGHRANTRQTRPGDDEWTSWEDDINHVTQVLNDRMVPYMTTTFLPNRIQWAERVSENQPNNNSGELPPIEYYLRLGPSDTQLQRLRSPLRDIPEGVLAHSVGRIALSVQWDPDTCCLKVFTFEARKSFDKMYDCYVKFHLLPSANERQTKRKTKVVRSREIFVFNEMCRWSMNGLHELFPTPTTRVTLAVSLWVRAERLRFLNRAVGKVNITFTRNELIRNFLSNLSWYNLHSPKPIVRPNAPLGLTGSIFIAMRYDNGRIREEGEFQSTTPGQKKLEVVIRDVSNIRMTSLERATNPLVYCKMSLQFEDGRNQTQSTSLMPAMNHIQFDEEFSFMGATWEELAHSEMTVSVWGKDQNRVAQNRRVFLGGIHLSLKNGDVNNPEYSLWSRVIDPDSERWAYSEIELHGLSKYDAYI